MITIKKVEKPGRKAAICDATLYALPDWFGREDSIVTYIKEVRDMPFWAAFEETRPIGFVALKKHTPYTAEICVIGILEAYHRQGIGKKLVARCEAFCAENHMEYLTVKTLDASRQDDGYAKTRKFYFAMGFRPLEIFPLLWDKDNPCLFMAKYLAPPV